MTIIIFELICMHGYNMTEYIHHQSFNLSGLNKLDLFNLLF